MGQNQYLRQNFSIGKRTSAKSGKIQEMENIPLLGVGRGGNSGRFFFLFKIFCLFLLWASLVLLVCLLVGFF